jgi:hypothetical protein
VFGRLLRPGSFDSLEGPLAHKQAFLPITFGNISFIPTTNITQVTYLRSWAFVASIIIVRFMVDQGFFLAWSLNTSWQQHLPFPIALQSHLRFSTTLTRTCFLPFEQLIGHQMVWFQDSILERLHHHTLSNMLFYSIVKPTMLESYYVLGPRWALGLQFDHLF